MEKSLFENVKATAGTDSESLAGADLIWETLINRKISHKVTSVLAKG